MTVERASQVGERPLAAAFLLSATLLSILLGFRVGMNRQDVVGYGLQVPAPGLDLSYTYAMNRASAEGRVFGREFVSTYGPFGYVIAAMDVGGSLGPWIVSQLLLTAGLGLAAGAHVLSLRGPCWSALGLALLVLTAIHVLADEYRWLSLVLLLVLIGLRAEGRGALAAFAAAGFLAGFGLLVKLSLGSGALLTVVVAAVVARPWRGTPLRLVVSGVAAAAGLGLGLWLHQGSLDGVADYVTAAAAVTSGYSSAMSLAEPDWWKAAAAFGVFVTCLAAALLTPGRSDLRVVAVGLAAPTFVAWKHGIVRQDQHVQLLALFGLVLGAVAMVEIAGTSGLRRARPWLLLGAVALTRVWFESPHGGAGPVPHLVQAFLQPLRLPGLEGLSTLTRLPAHRAHLAGESAATLESLRLPESARGLIGSASVDVYPWEASYVVANAFHWVSRPSPASFATYTPALDARNAAFFEAFTRPRFVLWHKGLNARSIDRRHLFWDEPLTLFRLLDRYEVAWRGEEVLLSSRPEPRFAPPERMTTVSVAWGEWLTLPRVMDGLLAEVEIDTSLQSRLRRALLREDAALVAVRFANGERLRFRYVPDQGPSGFWMDPLPRTADDVVALFRGQCPRTRVQAVRFLGGFRPGAPPPRITFWQVRGATGPAFGCRPGAEESPKPLSSAPVPLLTLQRKAVG